MHAAAMQINSQSAATVDHVMHIRIVSNMSVSEVQSFTTQLSGVPNQKMAAAGAGKPADKVWTAEELAATTYVAFQGGVYDMSGFAPGHPGGAELVTEWCVTIEFSTLCSGVGANTRCDAFHGAGQSHAHARLPACAIAQHGRAHQ